MHRLELEFEGVVIDLSDRDPSFLAISPTGKVPLLVDGDLKVWESDLICAYLAERHGWTDAFGPDLATRTRVRIAQKQWDGVVNPQFYASLREGALPGGDALEPMHRELAAMEAVVTTLAGRTDNMLAIHIAPFWARMDWLRELTPFPAELDRHEVLRAWLDRSVDHPSIRATLPERTPTVAAYRDRFASKP